MHVLEPELSGERAQGHVAEIGRFYRSPGSAGYHATIDYITRVLDADRIAYTTRSFALDGQTKLGGQATPLAWQPTGATLELVKPEQALLVDWHGCASCLPWWCRATPAGGVELEV